MFGWLRHWWSNGQVPERPLQSDLEWPDEEEWAFDYDAWKWVSRVKTVNPFNDGWEEDWDDVAENRPVNVEDIPMAEVIEDAPHQCCGGSCKMPPPLPPPDHPIWATGPVDLTPNGPVSVVQTEIPPVLAVYETEPPPSASSPPVIVSG